MGRLIGIGIILFSLFAMTSAAFGWFGFAIPDHFKTAAERVNTYGQIYIPQANEAIMASGHPDSDNLVDLGLRIEQSLEFFNNFVGDE